MKPEAKQKAAERDIARFWENVQVRSKKECWPWTGARFKQGQGPGLFKGHLGIDSLPLQMTAHKAAWIIQHKKAIPDGMRVYHNKCGNALCCNPNHLIIAGTSYEKGKSDFRGIGSKRRVSITEAGYQKVLEPIPNTGAPESSLTGAHVGALHEIRVANDMMPKGWHVYRALDDKDPFDLVARKGKKFITIQVKKATRMEGGGIKHGRQTAAIEPDILALSFSDGSIKYIPLLSE